MSDKIRQPTLADKLIANDPKDSVMDPTWYTRAIDRLRTAKKFVFDRRAAEYLGQMILEDPRVIADAQDFAIQPFEHMWVELPFQPFHRVLAEDTSADDVYGDLMVGYLFNGPTVNVGALSIMDAAQGSDRKECDFLPMEYTLHRPMTVDEQIKLADTMETSRMGLDLWFWGKSANAFIPEDFKKRMEYVAKISPAMAIADMTISQDTGWNAAGLRSLRANHTAQIAHLRYPKRLDAKDWSIIRQSSAGDLRNVIALLLFMNRTADIRYDVQQPMQHRLINRKPRALLPHSVITLKLDPMPRLRKLVAGIGIRRRLHDVRGHFCHDRTARGGCPHGAEHEKDFGEWWEEFDVLQWKCTHCNGKRWWRHEHKRGTHTVGVSNKDYAVTK